ncbi:energy transducer TonB [uncultured Campylobacter sp.]|uniref:energy transducer TonB family protein n=1 Tax=uncultured Campylobacter sp. TaxID=218934 RepID=UPI0026102BD6|nr:energy transducer TonB [uncultured Campylobacter sp.]
MRYFLLSLLFNALILLVPLPSASISTYAKDDPISIKLSLDFVSKSEESTLIDDEIKESEVDIEELKEPLIEEPKEVIEEIKEPQEVVKKIEAPKEPKIVKEKRVKKAKKSSIPPTQNLQKSSNLESRGFCKENVGFKIVNEKKEYELPKKARMLRLRGDFRAEVKFRLLKDGSVKILSSTGDKIFKEAAIELTKELQIEIIDKNSIGCDITKPYIFRMKR